MTPQELKNSILQLAIQGKLVEQRPEEGTAEDLYYRLKAEKASGVKKGKWGKSKSLTEIEDEEILFKIPDSWRWIRIGEIASVVTKGTTPRGGNVSYLDEGVGFLRAENVAGFDKIDKFNLKYIDVNTHVGFLKRSIIEANDLLITIAGTLGRTALVREVDLPLNANQAISIVRLVNTQDISLLFLIYALNSAAIQRYLTGQKKITAIPNLTLEIIENCLIPLPPLAEQKRIVSKIEELLPLIDRYEQAWTRLEALNKRFPEDMQKSLLQFAIQGKLVEQRPEEGTAAELYRQVQREKQALIKAGKLKKEKPLPDITEDEKPFEIPEGWMWVRFGAVISLLSGTDFKPEEYNDQMKGIPYITGASSLSAFGVILNRWTENPKVIAKKGDVLLVCKGSGYGKTVICDVEEAHIARQIMAIKKKSVMNMEYIMHFLNANLILIKSNGQGVIPGIDRESVLNMSFPLPPLAEQRRIVARLNELLPLCEKIK